MTTVSQRSFAAGEIAPALYARVDTGKYASGLTTCRNMFVMRHGGITNRAGSIFVGEVKDSTKAVRLLEFVFSPSQTYILEFGELYMRVIKDGVLQTEATQAITAVTQASPAVITITGHGYSDGDEVTIADVVGMTEINGINVLVANSTANTFEITDLGGTNIDSTAFTAYTSGGTAAKVYEIVTPYLEADLPTIQYVQSADIVTIVHPTYAPRELARTGDISWTLTAITFAPSISAPTGLATNHPSGTTVNYKVTSIKDETFEESLESSSVGVDVDPTATDVNITWNSVGDATEYNIYKETNGGVYGFIGIATDTAFTDDGIVEDITDTPPTARNPFSGADNYPSTVSYIQQRLMFGNTNNSPETVWGSRVGFFHNFTTSSPLQDDDSITFVLAGRQVNEVRHLVDLGRMISLTESGEWSMNGNVSGTLTPGEINPRQNGYNGANDLRPLIVSSTALFVQSRGTVVRDFTFDFQLDGYAGNDLTIFSAHLVDQFTFADWAYQKIPHSIVWAVRDDGVLLGLTYVREQAILGWHRHDFDGGTVENVAVVPEGNEDFVYVVVKRTIDGRSVRYIEKMSSRFIDTDAIEDSIFLDSALSYDGRNTTATTMTLSGGTTWAFDETITITASVATFLAEDVGNEIHFVDSDGDVIIRFKLEAFTSTTVMTGKPNKTVPASLQSTATTQWNLAVDELSGLFHLEGEEVSVFGDGLVVASPKNSAYVAVTVTDAKITLEKPYGVIHVGLPYLSDVETLDIDTAQSETLKHKSKNISEVNFQVEDTRGVFAGPRPPTDDATDPLERLYEWKIRDLEGYDSSVDLFTGVGDVKIEPEWNSNGRVFIRQVDPLPLTLLAVFPSGKIPFTKTRD